jgi:hypothetical protein
MMVYGAAIIGFFGRLPRLLQALSSMVQPAALHVQSAPCIHAMCASHVAIVLSMCQEQLPLNATKPLLAQ